MKITRFPQSCLLIETKGKVILVDPGNIDFKQEYYKYFEKAEYILVTHRHGDHCYEDVILNLMNKNSIVKLYSTSEVKEHYINLDVTVIKENNIIDLGNIKIEVVLAIHGYLPPMKGKKVNENVGYIIDDGENRLYISSDTICFENEYRYNIMCVGISDYGIEMGSFEASLLAKENGCDLVIPVHLDNTKYPVDLDFFEEQMNNVGINYRILGIEESIEI